MKSARDVKFVIYQVLYIFVVCVIALKGANIDLVEVISKKDIVKKQYADSLKAFIDSMLALGLVPKLDFDSAVNFEDFQKLQSQLIQMRTQLSVVQTQPQIKLEQPQIIKPEEIKKEEEEKPLEEKKVQADVQIQSSFTQYLTYTIKNPYNGTLVISADGRTLASIPPGGSGTFTLGGEKSITFRVGESSDTKPIQKKPPPEITMNRMARSGEGVSLREIQNTTGYRIYIKDIAPDQLKVTFSGPVRVTQSAAGVYDVTLNFLTSKSAFDTWTEGKDEPYSVAFTVTVVDAAGNKIARQGVFQFSEW